ncbi:hypothetical protein WMF39_27985 [Sorangium sp. So ce1504]|uniref:hypothetical protein n=1 Tax=Sorangium sp. So ce1504 TaxID=3133337 RepID=UPI003F60AC5B
MTERPAHLPERALQLGSAKTPEQRPPQAGHAPAPKPAHREPRRPSKLPNQDRSRPALNIPQRRRMGVQR